MSDIVDIDVDLDPAGYLQGVSQIDQANAQLQRSMGGVVTMSTGMQKALGLITPGRTAIAGMTLLAREAAQVEQGLSGLSANAAITGVSVAKLSGGIRQLARDMPLGYQASKATVEQFTRMGVAGEGTEKKILRLSTTVQKLAGATGEGPQALAQGMTDLARATGNNNLDPRRFAALGDSLTTVSAQSGASASSILAFSKNIAPMAQAAGIGATGILGISTAFSKIGEDGFGASTAINKMLTDMNRSVREGSPELKTYAMFVGKSADEFERLFKANPGEALTQVTEAIAKAGPNAPRMLEQIGIEGVRGTRSIQALVASGGLRPATQQALAAYGSGSTDKAAEAAFGGLNDSLSELGETVSQVSEAFGQPLLGPLTAFTNALKIPANMARGVAESGFMQKAIQYGAIAAMGLLVARNIAGPLGAVGLGRQILTSSPPRAFAAGFAQRDVGTAAARYGAGVNELYARTGQYGTGLAEGPARRMYQFGSRLREISDQAYLSRHGQAAFDAREAARQNPAREGVSPIRRFAGAIGTYGGQIGAAYGNLLANQYRNMGVDMGERRSMINGSTWGFGQRWQQAWTDARQSSPGNLAKQLGDFHKNLSASTTAAGSFGAALKAHAGAVVQAGKLMNTLGGGFTGAMRSGAGALGRGVAGLANGLGGPVGIAAMAGTALYFSNQAYKQTNEDRRNEFADSSISATLDRYRESIGMATGPTTTHGTSYQQMQTGIANATKTLAEAVKITDKDRATANTSKGNVVTRYAGDDSAVAGQIRGLNPLGLSPAEVQAIKVDLMRQRDETSVGNILKQLGPGIESQPGQDVPTGPDGGISATVKAIGSQPADEGFTRWFQEMFVTGDAATKWQAPTDPFFRNTLTDAQRQQVKQGVSETIDTRRKAQADAYGSDYASQEQFKAIDSAMADAIKTGNVSLVETLSKQFTVMLGGKDAETYISPETLDRFGGSFVKAFAGQNKIFAGTYGDYSKRQAGAGGQFAPELQESYVTRIGKEISPLFASFFDTRQKSPVQQAVASSMAAPENVAKSTTAINAMVDAARASGKSMTDLAVEAHKLAGTMSGAETEFALIIGTQQKAELEMSKQAIGMTDSQALMQRYDYTRKIAETPPSNNVQVEANRKAMEQENVSLLAQMAQRMKARLQMQRQYELQVSRMEEDAQRQRTYAQQDYSRQVARTLQAYAIQRKEQSYQFNISVKRSEEDFNTQRLRSLRDFNIQAEHSERDYMRGRLRSIRDFNKQLAREIQDAAASMMDPYARIQAKATWDAKNLLVNLKEQAAAMEKQKSQLDALRELGLSASAIDQLGLGKAENAQQVNNLMSDATMDPAVIKQLNDAAAARAAAGQGLFTDASNKDLQRQKDDFQQMLKDQAEDYAIAVKDNREALQRGLTDSQADFHKAMTRASADYQHALSVSQQQLGITLDHMAQDYNRAYQRTEEARQVSLARMREDLRRADEGIAGDFKTLNEQINRALNGQAVNWRAVVKNETQAWIKDMNTSVMPNIARVFGQLGLAPSTGTSSRTGPYANKPLPTPGDFNQGGPVQGYSPHPRADNILARLTAGEFVQPVDSVAHYGEGFMEALRNKRIPKNELPAYAVGGRVQPVPYPALSPWGHYPSGKIHRAIDWQAPLGTPVKAPYDARILKDGWDTTGFGNHLRTANLRGTFTILGHLIRDIVSMGQFVHAGQVVGYSGSTGNSTGPHLHEEERTRPYDPSTSFNFLKGTIMGVVGTSMLSGMMDVERLFAGLDQKRDGVYGKLRDKVKHDFAMKYDDGGIMEPGAGIHVNATGKPEKVLTDEQWAGISQLARVASQMITADDIKGIRAGRGVHIVVNSHDKYEYDYRNDFANANITVVADDPDQMARRLEEKQTRQRLTQTRGVRR